MNLHESMPASAIAQECIDIIVIGSKKAGTNWMQFTLKRHPQVIIPSLERIYIYGPEKDDIYAKLFCNCILRFDQRLTHVKGDYFISSTAMHEIAASSDRKVCKTGRRISLILCCRNPVERLYSDYAYDLRNGQTAHDFEEWLNSSRGQKAMILSSYGEAIEKWWDPVRLPCLITFTEEFGKFEHLQALTTFLQLSPFAKLPPNIRPNSSKLPRQRCLNRGLAQAERLTFLPRKLQQFLHRGREKLLIVDKRLPQMKASTRASLEAFFAPDIRKFENIIGFKTPYSS